MDIVTGAVNPSGRLPQVWPRSVGQVHQSTPWYARWWENNFDYAPQLSVPRSPLFPFGYGLSYSVFSVSGLSVSPATVSRANTSVSVTLTTSVSLASGPPGSYVVQVYYSQVTTSYSRFTASLLGFTKVAVGSGGSAATATVTVPLLDFAGYDGTSPSGYSVEASAYTVWVADNASAAPLATATLTVTA